MAIADQIARLNAVSDAALAKIAELRSASADGAPLHKVTSLIEDLYSRLAKLEASFVASAKSAPLPYRKG
jgi:hypothetical protein